MDSALEKARRAQSRAGWPGQKTTLAQVRGGEDLSATTTPPERLAMMWELALGAWSLSGKPLPTYARAAMPGRVVRPKAP